MRGLAAIVRCCLSRCIRSRLTPGCRLAGRPRRWGWWLPPLAAALPLGFASGATAHGFGERFDLPLPLWLWVTGAAATLLLTFAALVLFAGEWQFGRLSRRIDLLRRPGARRAAHVAAVVLRAVAAGLFLLSIAAGWFGRQDAYANLIVTMVWIVWWVGMAFVCALAGDLWEVVDPIRTLYRAGARVTGRLTGTRRTSFDLPYPERLGAWPAVVLFFGFAWAELIWRDKDVPASLASAVAAYAVLVWAGMLLFGVEAWRSRADAFAMAFRMLGRFAPLEVRSTAPEGPARLWLRPYGAGLLSDGPVPWSVAVFVLLMLSTVTFDGFHATPLMEEIELRAQTWRPVAEALFVLSGTGLGEGEWLRTGLLLLFPLAFVAIYAVVGRWMARLAGRDGSAGPGRDDVTAMVWSLVPIAVAYHLAHYYSLLLTAGQFLVPLASDPFGWGWNLFGTGGYKVDLTVVSPTVYWYASVALIVIGHVLAVLVAHIEALRRFGSHRAAWRSQLPMMALMVAYTSLSLWIMAQPIVG